MTEHHGTQYRLEVVFVLVLRENGHPLVFVEDLKTVRWLENYLLDFENTIIIVSHNRHFLNKVCTHICDVDFGKINIFLGNYDFWYQASRADILRNGLC